MPLPANIKAINLGCGLVVTPGWINIDNSPNARLAKYPPFRWLGWKLGLLSDEHYAIEWPKSTLVRDLRKPLPFQDGSIDYVYSSHFLEHLALGDAHRLFGEILRVLKRGGVVRLVVPDLAHGARKYLQALADNSDNGEAASEFINWLQLGRRGIRDPHLWMYDSASLRAMLIAAGFISPVVCEYKQGRVPDCEALDNRPGESLHIEAEKPQSLDGSAGSNGLGAQRIALQGFRPLG